MQTNGTLSLADIVGLILSLYEMTADDIELLADTILAQSKTAWLAQIEAQAALHGVSNASALLRGVDADKLLADAQEDARSIAATYNRELKAELERLYARNPEGDQEYYIQALTTWSERRAEYKALQIATTVTMRVVHYATSRFIQMNSLFEEKFACSGAPPKCPICIDYVRQGIVSFEFTQFNPLPAHPNCAHEWIVVNPVFVDNNPPLWVG